MEATLGRLDELDERLRQVDAKADRAAERIAQDPSGRAIEALRRELTEDLADARDGIGAQVAARDSRLSAFQDRLDQLDARLSGQTDDGPGWGSLPPDDPRTDAIAGRLLELRRAISEAPESQGARPSA